VGRRPFQALKIKRRRSRMSETNKSCEWVGDALALSSEKVLTEIRI
jgi:hypothetical protein